MFGANLRNVLAHSVANRWTAAISGLGVTALVQSSTATALIVSSFVGQGLVALPLALAVMLGADVGTSLMAVVFSFDLSWLSPLFIFVGVVLFLSRESHPVGRVGRILIGLGLMLLALRLVAASTEIMIQSQTVKALLGSISTDLLLEITVGAFLAVVAYSSLAIVLLTATMAASGLIPLESALGLVLGANLGSGLLAVLTTARSSVEVRQVPLGNLVFKTVGVAIAIPLVGLWLRYARPYVPDRATVVVLFHLSFNVMVAVLFMAFTRSWRAWSSQWLPKPNKSLVAGRPHHLDPSALATPSLAISCAAREALHQADVVETMMVGMLTVIKNNDLQPGAGAAQARRRRRRALFRDQVLPDQDLARGAGRGGKPALDRHHQLHHQHGADRRHHRAHPDRHRGQEDQEGPQLLRRRHGRDLRAACAADRQPAPGHERVPQRLGARRAKAAGRKGALSRPGARLCLDAPGRACRATPCRASRPARCTST